MELIQPLHEFPGGEPEKLRHILPITINVRLGEGGVLFRSQVMVDNRPRVEFAHPFHEALHLETLLGRCFLVAAAKPVHPVLQERQETGMDKFPQMEDRRLTAGDEGEEVRRIERREVDAEGAVDRATMPCVEFPENSQHMVLLVF